MVGFLRDSISLPNRFTPLMLAAPSRTSGSIREHARLHFRAGSRARVHTLIHESSQVYCYYLRMLQAYNRSMDFEVMVPHDFPEARQPGSRESSSA
jgi:hypothetical protein